MLFCCPLPEKSKLGLILDDEESLDSVSLEKSILAEDLCSEVTLATLPGDFWNQPLGVYVRSTVAQ